MSVVDAVASMEGGGPHEVERDEDGGRGEYPPHGGPKVIPCAVLAKPEKDMDVLIRTPSGEQAWESGLEGIRVIVGGNRGLRCSREKAERSHYEIVYGKPSEGENHNVAGMNSVSRVELRLIREVVVMELGEHPPRVRGQPQELR